MFTTDRKLLQQILKEIKLMSAALDALTAQVAQNAQDESLAVQVIQTLATEIATAVANNDSAALASLTTQLQTSAAALTAATSSANVATANTAVANVVASNTVASN